MFEKPAIKALKKYLHAQRKILEKWSEGDYSVKAKLWENLHACEEAAVEALEPYKNTDNGWIRVGDKSPHQYDYGCYLLFLEHGASPYMGHFSGGDFYCRHKGIIEHVTHWRLLYDELPEYLEER